MIYQDIERIVNKIIEDNEISEAPVDIEKICRQYGIIIEPIDADDSLSGFFIVNENQKKIIGYNRDHGQNRRRFTIAHELGHYQLHFKPGQNLFIDHSHKFFRNETSSTGEIKHEREANAFAAALLMPHSLLVSEIQKISNESQNFKQIIKQLSSDFQVSEQALNYRLANLGLIDLE